MVFKWITYFFLSNIVFPFFGIYSFYVIWGYWLKDDRLSYKIESMFLVPKGALLASVLGLLFTFLGTLPLSIIGAFMLKLIIPTPYRWTLYVLGGVMGMVLALLINKSHFSSSLGFELAILGVTTGMGLTWSSIMLLGPQPTRGPKAA